jgi:hypothetical protein
MPLWQLSSDLPVKALYNKHCCKTVLHGDALTELLVKVSRDKSSRISELDIRYRWAVIFMLQW